MFSSSSFGSYKYDTNERFCQFCNKLMVVPEYKSYNKSLRNKCQKCKHRCPIKDGIHRKLHKFANGKLLKYKALNCNYAQFLEWVNFQKREMNLENETDLSYDHVFPLDINNEKTQLWMNIMVMPIQNNTSKGTRKSIDHLLQLQSLLQKFHNTLAIDDERNKDIELFLKETLYYWIYDAYNWLRCRVCQIPIEKMYSNYGRICSLSCRNKTNVLRKKQWISNPMNKQINDLRKCFKRWPLNDGLMKYDNTLKCTRFWFLFWLRFHFQFTDQMSFDNQKIWKLVNIADSIETTSWKTIIPIYHNRNDWKNNTNFKTELEKMVRKCEEEYLNDICQV